MRCTDEKDTRVNDIPADHDRGIFHSAMGAIGRVVASTVSREANSLDWSIVLRRHCHCWQVCGIQSADYTGRAYTVAVDIRQDKDRISTPQKVSSRKRCE
jgi:hypothetical protein